MIGAVDEIPVSLRIQILFIKIEHFFHRSGHTLNLALSTLVSRSKGTRNGGQRHEADLILRTFMSGVCIALSIESRIEACGPASANKFVECI